MPKNEPFTADAATVKVKAALGNGRGTLLLAIVGVSLSTASAFTFCLASIGFDFSQLAQSAFWSRWGSMALVTLSTYAFVLLHKDEKNRLTEWFISKSTLLLNLSISTGLDFDSYLEEFNRQRRIAWYVNDINKKISLLNVRITKRKLKHKPTDDLEKRIEVYKECLSPEYLEANKNFLKTKSKPVRALQVLSGAQRSQGAEENFVSAGAFYAKKIIVKVGLSLVSTAAFASVVVLNFQMGINAASIVMTLFTLLSVVMSIMSAVFAANGCYKNVHVPNLLFKIKILSGYKAWKEKQPAKEKTPLNGAL